jgi:hypothetical protein
MPWNVNVPAANLTISSTTAPIQGNFQAIQTWTAVDHIVIDGAGGNEGKHAKVSLVQQPYVAGGGFTPAINPANGRGTLGIYAALNAANDPNSQSRMWAVIPIKNAPAAWEIANIPFTESSILFNQPANNSSGYTNLPSGMLIQYGSYNVAIPNSTGTFVTTAAVNFPLAFPRACFRVIVTPATVNSNASISQATSVTAASFVPVSVRVAGSGSGTTNFSYIAIGC